MFNIELFQNKMPEVAIPVSSVDSAIDVFHTIGRFIDLVYTAATSEVAIARCQKIWAGCVAVAKFAWAVLVVLVGLGVMAWEAWRTHQPIHWALKVYQKAQWLIETAKVAGDAEINDRVMQPGLEIRNEAGYRLMAARWGMNANRQVLAARIATIPTWPIETIGPELAGMGRTTRQMVAYPVRTIVKGVE